MGGKFQKNRQNEKTDTLKGFSLCISLMCVTLEYTELMHIWFENTWSSYGLCPGLISLSVFIQCSESSQACWRTKREGASKRLNVFPCVLDMHLNNSWKSHRTCKPTCTGRKEFRVGVMRCWQMGQEEIRKEKELA